MYTVSKSCSKHDRAHYTQYTLPLSGLTDASSYYVMIRAKSNSTDPEIEYSVFAPVAVGITPDVTAPLVPEN